MMIILLSYPRNLNDDIYTRDERGEEVELVVLSERNDLWQYLTTGVHELHI